MSFTRTCAKAFAGATLALAVSAAMAQNAAVVNNKPITKATVSYTHLTLPTKRIV